MKLVSGTRVLSASLLVLTLPLGCDGPWESLEGTAEDGERLDPIPWRDEWRTVIDQPFPVFEPDGDLAIGSLTIGGVQENENFANRGDVIVTYADTPRIVVEMRRFTMAPDEALAEEHFDELQIWAYVSSGSPQAPENMDPADACRDPNGATAWRDGCEIRVYYDGLSQLARSGADLRVTLPATWVGDLSVVTEDNAADADYHNRGNVCIEGLAGSADVTLGSGVAYVVLDEDVSPSPLCPPDDVIACEVAGWDPAACPCLASSGGIALGGTQISTHDASAADATIDTPADLWSSVFLVNESPTQTTVASTNTCTDGDGMCCDAVVDPSVGVYLLDETIGDALTRPPWRNQGSINFPGLPAVAGAGYSLQVHSAACQSVSTTEDPEDFVGAGEGTQQHAEERGNLEVCSDCLRGTSCEDLLAGTG